MCVGNEGHFIVASEFGNWFHILLYVALVGLVCVKGTKSQRPPRRRERGLGTQVRVDFRRRL